LNGPVSSETTRPAPPRLEDYPFRLSDNVRFADLDANQHVNNASLPPTLKPAGSRWPKTRDTDWCLLISVGWWYGSTSISGAELHWPGTVELGLGVTRFGRTSVAYEQVVFSEGKCVASAQSVTVLVNDRTRQPTPLTENIVRHLLPWRHGGYIEP